MNRHETDYLEELAEKEAEMNAAGWDRHHFHPEAIQTITELLDRLTETRPAGPDVGGPYDWSKLSEERTALLYIAQRLAINADPEVLANAIREAQKYARTNR